MIPLALSVVGIVVAFREFAILHTDPWMTWGTDAFAYWGIDQQDPYGVPWLQVGSFVYSPAFAQVVSPLRALGPETFLALWFVLQAAALVWLVRPAPWAILPILSSLVYEISHGNIHLFIAVAIALGFRYPATWAFVLLTKVTPGIGLLWFAVRGEWRSLTIALGVTALVAGVSLVLAPALWADWIALLTGSQAPSDPLPLLARLPIAALLLIWAARRDARWVVPIAATIALPAFWGFTVALAAVRLYGRSDRELGVGRGGALKGLRLPTPEK